MATIARMAAAEGELNDFIPALASVPRDKFGLVLSDMSGELVSLGACQETFSIQSISKLLVLIALVRDSGDELWLRIGARGSTAERFDSIAMLEFNRGIPTNPFLNAGALVMTDMLLERTDAPQAAIEELLFALTGDPAMSVNQDVAASEIQTADRNRALGYYLRSWGNLKQDVGRVVELYCRLCATELSCLQLARIGANLAIPGKLPWLSGSDHERLLSVLRDCGLYGDSFDVGVRFGLPAKSGSGGGILAIVAGRYGLGVWSPPLAAGGNSAGGMSILRQLGRALDGASVLLPHPDNLFRREQV
ncbi:glutaminase A [Mesorhizobium abyssinicae]